MKCSAVHSWLLGSERPDRPPGDLAAHLADCMQCRAWQRRLIRLEHGLKRLTTPSTDAKAQFVRNFVGGMPLVEDLDSIREWNAEEDARTVLANSNGEISTESTLIDGWRLNGLAAKLRAALEAPHAKLQTVPAPARRRVATVMAAALLLFAVTFWSAGPHGPFTPSSPIAKPGPDPLLARLMQLEMKLAAATEPKTKMQVLADIADDLRATQDLAETAKVEDLDKMAKLYEKVVSQSMINQAERVAEAEREEVFPAIADRLALAKDKARSMASTSTGSYREPLFKIAAAANQTEIKLRQLLGRKL
jgi:hypothetical protein